MAKTVIIKQGDTRPFLRWTPQADGGRVSDQGVRAFFTMTRNEQVVVDHVECEIDGSTLVYKWRPEDTARVGDMRGEFVILYPDPDGGLETDPVSGYIPIKVEASLSYRAALPLPDIAPENVGLPTLTGIARAGEMLAVSAGLWSGRPVPVVVAGIEAQQGEGGAIDAVEAGSVVAVEGWRYRAVEVATNGAGQAFAPSAWSAIASAALAAPVNVTPPVLEGDTLDGETLTGTEGVWTGNPAPVLTAVIQRQQGEDGAIQVAAQGLSVIAEAGWRYRIEVFATNGVGAPVVSAASEWSDVVTAGVQPLAGYLDAPNVTVLGASHASGTFGVRAGLNDTVAQRFARRGWTGTLRSFSQGGSNLAGARQQWQDALALPEIAAAVGRNVWIIDSAGNDIGAHLPYPNRADFVRDSLRALVEDIQATGDKVIFLPQTKRYAPWSGLTEASNLETDGILPYNLGIIHPLIAELTPDWANEDGRAYVDPYKLADAYRAIVGNDGNHGYGQNLADFVLGKATNRIKALDPAAPRSGSIIWGARTTTQAYAYGNRNELNPAQGGPDLVEANNLARFNYMVGAGKTDGGVDDFVTFKMGPFGGRAGGPGIGGAGRVADPLMATAETLGSGWYVQDLNAGFVEIHGLVPASQVQLSIVAASTSSTGRTGRYTLTGGEQVTFDATTTSPSNYHKFAPIAVPADGKVRLDFVSATGTGGFALLNALRLDYL